MKEKPHYRFASYRVEIIEGVLYRDEEVVPLSANEFALLVRLIEKRRETVGKRELSQVIREAGSVKDKDETVTRYVANIRARLGDSPRKSSPRFIRSVSRRGYQFIYQDVVEVGFKRALAVTPFKTLGRGNSELDLGVAMAEFLNASLTDLHQFRMVPSNELNLAPRSNPADKAGVTADYLITGKVMVAGRQIFVSPRLVRWGEDEGIWAKMYRVKETNIYEALESIAGEVAEVIPGVIKEYEAPPDTNSRGDKRARHLARNVAANTFYELGWSCLHQRTPSALLEGLRYFEKAARNDPEFAAAYAGVADCYVLLSIFGSEIIEPKKAMPRAKAAALKALELDQTLGEAHASLASVKVLFEWDWAGAEEEFRLAINYNPEYATAHHWFAHNLALMGRHEEALKEIRRAQELHPASPIISATISRIFFLNRDYKNAIEAAKQTIDDHHAFFLGYAFLGIVYKQTGALAEAISHLQEARKLGSTPDWGNPAILGELGHALALAGKTREAKRIINQLENLSSRQYVGPINYAKIFLGLGNLVQVFKYLEEAYRHKSAWLITFNIDPFFDPLRDEPKFQSLVRRIGLPEQN